MKKVLFFINSPTPYQLEFFEYLSKIINLKVIFHDKKLKNYNFTYNKKNYLLFLNGSKIKKKFFINSLIERFKPDFIIFGGYKLNFTSFIINICNVKGIKFLFWLEKIYFKNSLKKILLNLYFKLYLKKSSGILAVGEEAKKFYKKYNKNTINFHYSIKIKKKINKNFFHKKKINFLYVGQFIERKNILNLLRAFRNINHENATLTLIGEGGLKSKMNFLSNDDKRIKILNFKNDKFLKKYYKNSDVFILPSKYDGWGVVIMEAMSYKCAVIVTNSSGVSNEFIKNNYNGKIIGTTVPDIMQSIKYYINYKNKIISHGRINKLKISKSDANSEIAANKLKKFLHNT